MAVGQDHGEVAAEGCGFVGALVAFDGEIIQDESERQAMDFPAVGDFEREGAGGQANAPAGGDPLFDGAVLLGGADEQAFEQSLSGRGGLAFGERGEVKTGGGGGQSLDGFDRPIIPTGDDGLAGGQRGVGDALVGGKDFGAEGAVRLGCEDGAVGGTGGGRGAGGEIDGDESEIEACVVAVASEQPLLDGLVHGFGAQADEGGGGSGRGGRGAEVGEEAGGVGHGLQLPSAGGGPRVSRRGRGGVGVRV